MDKGSDFDELDIRSIKIKIGLRHLDSINIVHLPKTDMWY